MKKIPTLYLRDPNYRAFVTTEINPACQWVIDGEGTATRKWDGTCVRYEAIGDNDYAWWARREVKNGKTPPPLWVPEDHDPITGNSVGWEPIEQSPFAKFHAEAIAEEEFRPGTYELLGPRINGNPDDFAAHLLMPHGWAPLSQREQLATAPRDWDGLREWLTARDWEGIVWHHPDGRRAKLKRRDFRS